MYSDFYIGKAEITSRKTSKQKMYSKGAEKPDKVGNIHQIGDSEKVTFVVRPRGTKCSSFVGTGFLGKNYIDIQITVSVQTIENT